MRRLPLSSGLGLLGAVALVTGSLQAQPRPPGPRPPQPQANAQTERPLTLQEATERLRSANPDEVRQGVDALTRIGTPAVIRPLVELIHSGLPDGLLNTVVEKLGIIGRPEAIDELSSLLHHRRAAVREAAVKSLSQIRDNRVRPLIESALRDSENSVRTAAAQALGEINARQSVELLQRAFERNVPAAAESIGRLGDPASANRLLEAVGRAPLGVLLPGFRRFLDRRDLDDAVKFRIVEQLVSRSPTAQVKAFLQEWVQGLPPTLRTRSRARAARALRQLSDAPGAPTGAAPAPPAPAPPAAPATPAGGAP